MTPYHHELLATADAYCAHTCRKPGAVCHYIGLSGDFLTRVRSGKNFGVEQMARAMQWFSDYWPRGAPWPKAVPRPRRNRVPAS